VPAKVAINEAIELAKNYGGDTSGRFVNGVLGAVYKELGEPGKDEISKKKKKDIPKEQMPLEQLGGSIVYAKSGPDIFIALVHDVFGHWTLSKGHIESNESVENGTVRGIKEELGLDITIQEKLGENEYIASDPEKGKKRKHVHYFLAESPYVEMTPEKKGGLDDARWFKLADILELNFYNDILPIVTKAVELILKRTGRSADQQ
jgi:ADP-ribose pyrophosphatase YjhB (NUDIX family)